MRKRAALPVALSGLWIVCFLTFAQAAPSSRPTTQRAKAAKVISVNGWIETNLASALSLARGKRPILMQVHAHWCSPCNQLTYEVIDTPAGRKLLKQAVGVRVDFETAAGREVTRKYGILGLPTTLVLTAKGEEIGRVLGYGGRQYYVSAIKDALAGKKGFKAVEAEYKKNPKNSKNQMIYAQALLHKGREAEAKALLQGLMVKGNPYANSAFRIWGRWLVRVKRDGIKGAKHFERAMKFFKGTRFEMGHRYWAAKGYQVGGQPAKALALLDERIKKQPKNLWALFTKVDFMVHYKHPVKRIEKSMALLRKKMPNQPWLLYLSAQVKMRKNDRAGALKDIQAAIQRNPRSAMFKYYAQQIRKGKGS